ncbi:MAG: hypothetical protein M3032_10535, partial [Verrucomicrobiota bacterium]|nr:hypothetical protein [Verrucomicrobiota bacterium]
AMWGGLALFAASAWDRMPARFRIAGLCLTSAAALAVIGYLASIPAWPESKWFVIGPALVLIAAGCAAIYFVVRERETVAISILFLAMVPCGLSVAEGMMRFDPQFSLASAAGVLQGQLGKDGEVLFEGRPMAASSLLFYLDRPFRVVDENAALTGLAASHPVYLIIDKERVAFWQERLTARFHIYHQETTCGPHVVISNQP